MTMMTVSDARKDLYNLVNTVHTDHNPLFIRGKHNNAVLVSEEDWTALQETLHLVSQPGMRQSIIDGMQEPISTCKRSLEW